MILRNLLLMGVTGLMLAACGGGKPAPDLYVLRTSDDTPAPACMFTRSVTIDRPGAPKEYDTKRIAILLERNHLSYYTGAAWASPFPEQLQAFMSDALAQRGVHVLDGDADDSHASLLHLSIREANVTEINAPVVRLRLAGTIGKKRFSVNESVAASENHMPQIVDAYSDAASRAADSIIKAMKGRCPGIPARD